MNKNINKEDFIEIKNDTKILRQLYNKSGSIDGKINKKRSKYIKDNLETESLKNHFLIFEEMNLLDTSPYNYYEQTDKIIASMKLAKIQKVILQKFIILLFEQYKIEENEIIFFKNMLYYEPLNDMNQGILKSKDFELIKKELDLFWVLQIKDLVNSKY